MGIGQRYGSSVRFSTMCRIGGAENRPRSRPQYKNIMNIRRPLSPHLHDIRLDLCSFALLAERHTGKKEKRVELLLKKPKRAPISC